MAVLDSKEAERTVVAGPPNAPRGRITIGDGRTTVEMLEDHDEATYVYLMGPKFLDELLRDAELPDAPSGIRADAATALRYLRADTRRHVLTSHFEQWARWSVEYVAKCTAPTVELQSTFALFHQWLGDRRPVEALPNDGPPPEIDAILTRLSTADSGLITDAEIATYRRWRETLESREFRRAAVPDEVVEVLDHTFGPGRPLSDHERSSLDRVHADVKAKLLRAGLPDIEADANAALTASRYAARAARLNEAPAVASDPQKAAVPSEKAPLSVPDRGRDARGQNDLAASNARGAAGQAGPERAAGAGSLHPAIGNVDGEDGRARTTQLRAARPDERHDPVSQPPPARYEMGSAYEVRMYAAFVDQDASGKAPQHEHPRQPDQPATSPRATPARTAADLEPIYESMYPTKGATLWRLNGIGTTMLGGFYDPRLVPKRYSILWFTFLFMPLIPLKIYLVSAPRSEHGVDLFSLRFHAGISWSDFSRHYPGQLPKFIISGLFEGMFVGSLMIGLIFGIIYLFSAVS